MVKLYHLLEGTTSIPIEGECLDGFLESFWDWRLRTGNFRNLWRDFLAFLMDTGKVFGLTDAEIVQSDEQLDEWHRRLIEARPSWFKYPDDE